MRLLTAANICPLLATLSLYACSSSSPALPSDGAVGTDASVYDAREQVSDAATDAADASPYLLEPEGIDSENIEQFTTYESYDQGLITTKAMHAAGQRMNHPRLLRDTESDRVFLSFHAASNRPFNNGIVTPAECPEGVRTVILNEANGSAASGFRYSSLVAADCGYRIANAELFLHQRKLYIPYIAVGGADGCRYESASNTAIPVAPGSGGKRWQIKLKVSGPIDDAPIAFSGLSPESEAEVLVEVCVPNYVRGGGDGIGSAEPFIHKIEDDVIHLVYADEYLAPPYSCGQVIRQLKYSIASQSVLSDTEAGNCPGNGTRDGMPVITYHPESEKYFMIFESLHGGSDDQIILMESTDGESWSNRRELANSGELGASAVGIPYIKNYGSYMIAAFVSIHEDDRSSKLRLLLLDKDGNKTTLGNGAPQFLTLLEEDFTAEDKANLFWGSIEIVDDWLYATSDHKPSGISITRLNLATLFQ